MSHIATVNVEIKDLAHLQTACERVGLEFVRDQTNAENYYLGDCLHVVRIPQDRLESIIAETKAKTGVTFRPSEIAVCRSESGAGYGLRYEGDFGGWGLETVAGKACGLLKQSYAIVAARAQAIKNGFQVREFHKANGAIELRLCK